ncbi:benzoylformate decarboxylase [Nonomuraea soli]|uniref:Benzoylformate decarboxylase n=1 Tax=Nonomuraea soli TaxID=1032476 RepID=A0A7W0CG73_9ACTN|nr:benzoylformate decarboxylase [Nonomuraea soli]MBA2890622.1 benzoylformate decarboxylase [Nonomuraea soli]
MTTVREALHDWMRGRGLTTLFGNPGSTELPMLDRFPFRYVLGLQEAVVVGMADGFAAASGTPALVNLHTGPGVGNAMGAILTAAANRTPMIVTAGQQTREMLAIEPLLTNVDATLLPRPAVKWAHEPARAADVPAAFERAYHLACAPPCGPVFLSLPMDDFDQPAAPVTLRSVAHAATADVGELAARLDRARRPVLVVGSGAGWEAAIALAERCSLPVWEAPLEGRLAFPHDHPCFQGQLAPAIAPLAGQLSGHDLVIVAGAPVFRYYPHLPGPYLPEGAELAHLTCDAAEAARAPVGSALVGDVPSALRALAALCEPREGLPPRRPEPAPAATPVSGSRASRAPVVAAGSPTGADRLDPAAVMATLARAAPADTIWVNESPSNRPAFHDQIRPGLPGSFYFSSGGGLGYGMAAAVGVQLARPARRVIAVIGDGSAQYAVPALWSAAAYGVPVTFVVLSNSSYAVLKWFAGPLAVPGLDIPGIDIVSIARGYGIPATTARSAADLDAEIRRTGHSPALIEVPIR